MAESLSEDKFYESEPVDLVSATLAIDGLYKFDYLNNELLNLACELKRPSIGFCVGKNQHVQTYTHFGLPSLTGETPAVDSRQIGIDLLSSSLGLEPIYDRPGQYLRAVIKLKRAGIHDPVMPEEVDPKIGDDCDLTIGTLIEVKHEKGFFHANKVPPEAVIIIGDLASRMRIYRLADKLKQPHFIVEDFHKGTIQTVFMYEPDKY